MNTFKWNLNCEDGQHTVMLQQLGSPRDPMQLYVDGEKTDLSIKPKSLFVKIEYAFTCGGQPALLLVFGNKVDLVFQGVFQSAKKKYDSKNAFPIWIPLLMSLLNLFALVVSKGISISILMSLSSSLLVYVLMITPFSSRKGKLLEFALITILNWAIAIYAPMIF